ncbi:putative acid shock protein [Yersinia enterocolitica]|nr:putative acid shock protein [Yersinia enterocolitica]
MKTVLAMIVAATLGMSSIAFAADTVAPVAAPMATAPAAHSVPAKTSQKSDKIGEKSQQSRPDAKSASR